MGSYLRKRGCGVARVGKWHLISPNFRRFLASRRRFRDRTSGGAQVITCGPAVGRDVGLVAGERGLAPFVPTGKVVPRPRRGTYGVEGTAGRHGAPTHALCRSLPFS